MVIHEVVRREVEEPASQDEAGRVSSAEHKRIRRTIHSIHRAEVADMNPQAVLGRGF